MNEFTITQLTDNNFEEIRPDISGENVVWTGNDGNDDEIFLYDGNTTTQITDNNNFIVSLIPPQARISIHPLLPNEMQ